MSMYSLCMDTWISGISGNKLHRFADMIRQPLATAVMDAYDGPGQRDSQDALAHACHVSGRDLRVWKGYDVRVSGARSSGRMVSKTGMKSLAESGDLFPSSRERVNE